MILAMWGTDSKFRRSSGYTRDTGALSCCRTFKCSRGGKLSSSHALDMLGQTVYLPMRTEAAPKYVLAVLVLHGVAG